MNIENNEDMVDESTIDLVPNTNPEDIEEEVIDEELVEREEKNGDAVVPEINETPANSSTYRYVNKDVTMTANPRRDIPKDTIDTREALGIVSLTKDELDDFVSQQSFKANMSSATENYIDSLQKANLLTFNDTVIEDAINNGGEFVQTVEHEANKLHATVPLYKSGDNLSGFKAIAKIQRALNQGSFLTFPCWASGVWITIRAPTTFELADYYDAVSEEIIEIGKQTGGATYGNSSVYLAKYLMDLVEKLVYKCSVKDLEQSDIQLRDILVIDDLQTIAWALGTCMYPNGYPFEEACTVDVEKCTHVYKTNLNISKMFWVNRKRLTNWQLAFMGNKTTKRSRDEVIKYQLDADWLQSESIGYPGFKVLVKTPTIGEHISAGYSWIADVEQSIRQTLGNLSDSKLNKLVMERAGLTLLRTYSHYVKAFVYDDGAAVNNKVDIDATINNICTSPDIVKKFTDDIKKHISKSTISMVAIPRHKCSECDKDNHIDEQTHPHLIPIDGMQLFFALRDQKLQLM